MNSQISRLGFASILLIAVILAGLIRIRVNDDARSLSAPIDPPTEELFDSEIIPSDAEELFERTSPRIGDTLPDLVAYDESGNEFNLKDLKGSYTVLVFGCLT